ncbi:MAG: thioredoxin family protein [Dehalococcoidia bacterium]|nr:thioredoxin family protein [Dehalococcoidia bacterium]
MAHSIALENSNITADVIEVEEFPNLAQRYTVRSVPKTVLGNIGPMSGIAPPIQFVGAVTEAQFVEKVLEEGVGESEGITK